MLLQQYNSEGLWLALLETQKGERFTVNALVSQEVSHLEESIPAAFTGGRMWSDANTGHKTALREARDRT